MSGNPGLTDYQYSCFQYLCLYSLWLWPGPCHWSAVTGWCSL